MNQSKPLYKSLSEEERLHILNTYYINQQKSFDEISEMYNTYPNKLRRDAKKFNIPVRSRSEAQKNALETGRIKHPTKGTKRTEETKQKIGMGLLESWKNIDPNKLEEIKNKQKTVWNNKTEEERANLQRSANQAIRVSSKVGSKLEKFLLGGLIDNGIDTRFHYEQQLVNTKLQIDLYIPTINLAIEVDGPSHFDPVWGQDTLKRTQTYDNKKQGLILGKGMSLVRIKQKMDFSKSRSTLILGKLLSLIENLTNNTLNDKYYEIEDI